MEEFRLQTAVPTSGLRSYIHGYGAMVDGPVDESPDTTTEEYADAQASVNARKTFDFILPLVEREGARTVLDIGCGIGVMVKTLLDQGYNAYGTDLCGLAPYWARQNLPLDRLFIIDAADTKLPFLDNTIDFGFTLGVIEHVGTSDGHCDRLPNYHDIRRRWLLELLRVVRDGGSLLIGGPNRNFPVDVAHGLDSKASRIEHVLSGMTGASIHKPWGSNFLWGYSDLRHYLKGLPYVVEPLSINNYIGFSRVPRVAKPLVEWYVRVLPKFMLGTGCNPWMMALIHKTDNCR